VENPVIKLENFGGAFEVLPTSDVFRRICLKGSYEVEHSTAISQHLSQTRDAIDVGANMGFFAVLMAQTAKSVLALEPEVGAHEILQRNIARNQLSDRVTVIEAGASDRSGEVELRSVSGRPEYSSIGDIVHPSVVDQPVQTQTITLQTIDDLVEEHDLDPAVIKLDIEGAEFAALSGAIKTLERSRPVLLLEVSNDLLLAQGSSAKQVADLLLDHRYRLLNPVDVGQPYVERPYTDILAIPQENS